MNRSTAASRIVLQAKVGSMLSHHTGKPATGMKKHLNYSTSTGRGAPHVCSHALMRHIRKKCLSYPTLTTQLCCSTLNMYAHISRTQLRRRRRPVRSPCVYVRIILLWPRSTISTRIPHVRARQQYGKAFLRLGSPRAREGDCLGE